MLTMWTRLFRDKRVLKPGGWAILMVPINPDVDTFEDPSVTDPEERKRLFGQYDHVRQFGRDYADVLSKAGFKVTADRLYYELPDEKEKNASRKKGRGTGLCCQSVMLFTAII